MQQNQDTHETLVTVSEVARELEVSEQTIRNYEARKILKGFRLSNGTRVFRREETNNSLSDLSDLRGCRFVQTSETEKGQRLAEGKLKRISQGIGKIKACRKYENPIEFLETHKLWIDANHKIKVKWQ